VGRTPDSCNRVFEIFLQYLEEEEVILHARMQLYAQNLECVERLRGFPGTWVFYALASPH
jgi:hypothetical protein